MSNRRYKDAKTFYCPNGHGQSYTESEAYKLKKQLKASQEDIAWYKGKLEQEQNSSRSLKGIITKQKKRIQHGVCPCCKRSFQNLRRHMSNKHPEFSKS